MKKLVVAALLVASTGFAQVLQRPLSVRGLSQGVSYFMLGTALQEFQPSPSHGEIAVRHSPGGPPELVVWDAFAGDWLSYKNVLVFDETNIAALRNGTASQELRIYDTYTSPTQYERLAIYGSNNVPGLATSGFAIEAQQQGGAAQQSIVILPTGSGYLQLGDLSVQANNIIALNSTTNRFTALTGIFNENGNRLIDLSSNTSTGISVDLAAPIYIEVPFNNANAYYLSDLINTNPGTAPSSYFLRLDSRTGQQETQAGFPFVAASYLQANLPGTVSNGAIVYCTDCNPDATCTAAGAGAFAFRINGAWACELN